MWAGSSAGFSLNEMTFKPIASTTEGMGLVDSFKGDVGKFQLIVPDSLNDAAGITMALIMDRVLAKGWQPDGYAQADGYRIYRYREL